MIPIYKKILAIAYLQIGVNIIGLPDFIQHDGEQEMTVQERINNKDYAST